jgi:hypothetical protein
VAFESLRDGAVRQRGVIRRQPRAVRTRADSLAPTMKPARSHYVPRTSAGRLAVAAFVVLFAFTQPPLVFRLANRVEPWIGGVPFLYAYLLILYVALILVLLWAKKKDL